MGSAPLSPGGPSRRMDGWAGRPGATRAAHLGGPHNLRTGCDYVCRGKRITSLTKRLADGWGSVL